MTNGQIRDLASRQASFKLVLDQYEKFLLFCADISLKCITIGFGFYGFFFTIHRDKSGIDSPTRWMIIVIALIFGGLYCFMQFKYWQRTRFSAAYLKRERIEAEMPTLHALGILDDEHDRIFMSWSLAVIAIIVSVIVVIYRWPVAPG